MSTNDDDEELLDKKKQGAIVLTPFSSPARTALQKKLQALNSKRYDLQRSIDQLDSEIYYINHCLSPIGHTPPEILAEIFLYCCPEDFAFRLTSHVGPRVKFNVLDVCQKWRAIAHDTPLIWHRLDIRFPLPREIGNHDTRRCQCIAIDTEKLKTWLSKATFYLSVTWYHPVPDFIGGDVDHRGIHRNLPEILLPKLVTTAGSWRSLDFTGRDEERDVLWKSGVSMDSLVDLKFVCHSIKYEGMEPLDYPLTQLQDLRVGNEKLIKLFKSPTVLRLSIGESHFHDWQHISTAFPQLEDLSIDYSSNRMQVPDQHTHLLANLRSLEFGGSPRNLVDLITEQCTIGPIHTPKLKVLRFRGGFYEIELVGFIGESVESLELSVVNLHGDNARRFLDALPSLRSIKVDQDHDTAYALINLLQNPSICPDLVHVVFTRVLLNLDALLAFSKLRAPTSFLDQGRSQCLVTLNGCTMQRGPQELPDVKDADHPKLSGLLGLDSYFHYFRAQPSL